MGTDKWEFSRWITNKFIDWQKEQGERRTQSEFAEWLGVEQQAVSRWMNGTSTPRGGNLTLIALRLGDDVYTVLGKEKPKRDSRLQAINEWWSTLTEETRDWLFTNATRQHAATALREGKGKE